MTVSPRIVLAMPAYNRPDSLAQTIESILGQTRTDFALIVIDDAATEETDAVIARYRQLDPRISYERNQRRLGMVKNWRKCFQRAREAHPGSEYFAWVSDHDFWHPRWLERLAAELDASPDAVLAYPRTLKLHADAGARVTGEFETMGMGDPVERVRRAAERMFAGDMIYGLFRASALAAAGVFRPVLMPDRQVLLGLAALGEFRQVPEVLWYRQVPQTFSVERQRAAFFTGVAPLYTYLPYYVQHYGLMVWDFALCGRGGTRVGRTTGWRAAAAQLVGSIDRARLYQEAAHAARREPPDEAVDETEDETEGDQP